ncbi:hypothetical protein PHA77_01760 [Edwardsiella tarda]|uniref:hypothetical protein n=1 Tax=Edwardsiella tarda TaxID=636 RepID=UPI0024440B31|nr:hypothetical protein [Edwardsiella tarda]WGE29422.1 hypothetical protein PHA77_01760 [Edwardsiella tarda]
MSAGAVGIKLGLSPAQVSAVKTALRDIELTPAQKKRLIWRIAKYGVMRHSAANARAQHTPDNRGWAARKPGHGNKKMLRKLPKMMVVRQIDDETARVVFNGGSRVSAAVIAYAQQNGATITQTKGVFKNRKIDKKALATKYQAKKLVALGFRAPEMSRHEKTGRYTQIRRRVRVSQSWIREHITRAQAGVIIKTMEGKTPKASWQIHLPARAFLGITDAQLADSIVRALQGIRYGANVKKQDIKRKKS